ncbi:MAG: class I SAM-dependent methyltransferase [Paracoccaceae bacterium]
MQILEQRKGYWNTFYVSRKTPARLPFPSQFAAFIASELPDGVTIFDLGCGNARDSLFFAQFGFDVFGFDQSGPAIDSAQKVAATNGLDRIKFTACDIDAPEIRQTLKDAKGKQKCVYARFFLHAITGGEQSQMFRMLAEILEPGDLIAFEFRTDEDADADKVMGHDHFRRYQSLDAVLDELAGLGFTAQYSIQGRGYAKYKSEDATVARCILER